MLVPTMQGLRDIARRLRESRAAWLELVREAESQGLSYEAVRRVLEEEGVSPPSKSYWSSLRSVYSWATSRGLDLDLISRAGVSKAKLVSRLPVEDKEVLEDVLKKAVSMRQEDFREYVQQAILAVPLGEEALQKSLSEPFSSIRVPSSTKERLDVARSRVARVLMLNQLSEVAFLEFVAEVFGNLPQEVLRGFWSAVYGE